MKKTEQRELLGKGTVEQREKGRRMFEALAEAFCRPIIGHTAWKDSITHEQKLRIQLERMKQIKDNNGEKIDMATDYEAMIYISTASLANPLSPMWARIYFHLFKRFYPEKSDFVSEHEATLHDYTDEPELIRLKRWLYKQSKTR